MHSVQTIGPYRIVSRIGAGGMANVYLGTTQESALFARPVAIKRILAPISDHPEFRSMFTEELRLMGQLHHPNIVQALDAGFDGDGRPYMVMEYVCGVDLRDLLRGVATGAVPASLVVHIATKVALALDYIHSSPLRVVHRDVTPSNILLGEQGDVKLSDFGISRFVGRGISSLDQPKGKLGYMAPEQFSRPSEVDHRSDLFSLGAVLYEMLASRPAFRSPEGTDAQTMQRVLHDHPKPLLEVRTDVPPGLSSLVHWMLAKDRRARPNSASDVVESLMKLPCQHDARELQRYVRERRRTHPRGGRGQQGKFPLPCSSVSQAPGEQSPEVALAEVSHARPQAFEEASSAPLAPIVPADRDQETRHRFLPCCDAVTKPGPAQEGMPPLPAQPMRETRTALFVPHAARRRLRYRTAETCEVLLEELFPEAELDHEPLELSMSSLLRKPAERQNSVGCTEPPPHRPAPPGQPTQVLPAAVESPPAQVRMTTASRAAVSAAVVALAAGIGLGEMRSAASESKPPAQHLTGEPEPLVRALPREPAPAHVDLLTDPSPVPPLVSAGEPAPEKRAFTPAAPTAPAQPLPSSSFAAERARPRTELDPSSATASVRVVVVPWGQVWVDGHKLGVAPVEFSRRPGRYRIAIGQGKPSQMFTVTLRDGQNNLDYEL